MTRCECKTLTGKRCSRAARYDSYCWQHKKCKNIVKHAEIPLKVDKTKKYVINDGKEVIDGKVVWQPAVVINDTRKKRKPVTEKMAREIGAVAKKLEGYYTGISFSDRDNGSTNIRMQVLNKTNIPTITKAIVQIFGGVYDNKLLKKEKHPYMPNQYRYIIF